MEFFTTLLCIAFSFVLINAPCVSSLDENVHGVVDSTHTTKLPRKIGIGMKDTIVNAYVSKAFIPDINKKGTLPGRPAAETSSSRLLEVLDGKSGTRQKWVDAHMWEYFTMDYSHVRRRRPVHNKSIPSFPRP